MEKKKKKKKYSAGVDFFLPFGITNTDPDNYKKFLEQQRKTGYLDKNRQEKYDILDKFMDNVNKFKGDIHGVLIQEMCYVMAEDMKEDRHFSVLFDIVKKVNERCNKGNLKYLTSIVQLSNFFPSPTYLPEKIMKKAYQIVDKETEKMKTEVLKKPIIKEFTEGERKYIVTIRSKYSYAVRDSSQHELITDWIIRLSAEE